MTADGERLLGEDALADVPARLRTVVEPRRVVIGWATVELDRAQTEVAEALAAPHGLPRPEIEVAPDDTILGARCRRLRLPAHAAGPADPRPPDVLLLEPSTEGRLAAALARHGEGPVARYLLVDAGAADRARRAGFTFSAEAPGPLGAERLVIAGPRWGPFLLLVAE